MLAVWRVGGSEQRDSGRMAELISEDLILDDIARFSARYEVSGSDAFLAAEMDALGSDYQANGYTTMAQAMALGRVLDLEPGQRLVDVGAGCGWPGLHLAKTFGCHVISVDVVHEGTAASRDRAIIDGIAGRSWSIQASATSLPLRPRSVDAVVHSDVMC